MLHIVRRIRQNGKRKWVQHGSRKSCETCFGVRLPSNSHQAFRDSRLMWIHSHVCHSCFIALPITPKKNGQHWNFFYFSRARLYLIVSLWKRISQHILLPISSFHRHIIYCALSELMKYFVLTNVDGIRDSLFPQNSLALSLQSLDAKIKSHFQIVWCWLQTKMMFRKMPMYGFYF